MRKMLLLVIVILFYCFQGVAMAESIFEAVQQFRKENKEADVDISIIARRYISIGKEKREVERYFRQNEFVFNDLPVSPEGGDKILAVYVKKGLKSFFGFHDEIRIIVVFNEGRVVDVSGRLIYRSL
ncbi:hypothetical protein ACEU07_13665 [Chromobacterium violaceum]|uniref:hypothetical protein n=1 Tax=Chromobacterium violaceum TaxID=536 RepID=UPI0035A6DB49